MKIVKVVGILVCLILVLFNAIQMMCNTLDTIEDYQDVIESLCWMLVGLSGSMIFYHLEPVLKHTVALLVVVCVLALNIREVVNQVGETTKSNRQRAGSYSKIYRNCCKQFERNYSANTRRQ